VLIRPRSGNFTYSEHTFSQMLGDIAFCRQLGYEGIVTGCLHGDNRLDVDRMGVLAEACADLHLTFHRAFDRIPNWKQALTELETLGVDTILTSGQAASAEQGLSRLEELVKAARCGIMPGGGIRPGILQNFQGKGFEAVHLSALGAWPAEAPPAVPLNSPQLLREGASPLPDEEVIQEVVGRVRGTWGREV
jgi:copper homeostasis protein